MEIPIDIENSNFETLLSVMPNVNASDLHLQVGSVPILRIQGALVKTTSQPVSSEKMDSFLHEILSEENYRRFTRSGDLDVAVGIKGYGRVRINIYYQRGKANMAARLVKSDVPDFEELHLPEKLRDIADFPDGLVIVAGVTGCGKSTTLAAIIEHINRTKEAHILTIEDPIEYVYANKKALISQREIGIDVASFSTALKYALREDPDIIIIGEMRDSETIEFGLTAAETGHLVFGTLHSGTAAQTVGRILDFFKPDEHAQVRSSLIFNLRSIVCQKLLPAVDKEKRIPAVEIMINNPTVRDLINKGEEIKIPQAIAAGESIGMQDFNKSLADMVKANMIEKQVAMRASPKPEALEMRLKGIHLDQEKSIF